MKLGFREGYHFLFKHKILLVSTVLIVLSILLIPGILFSKTKLSLDYNIKPFSLDKKQIQVSLEVKGLDNADYLEFYQGDILISDLKSYNVSSSPLNIEIKDGIIRVYHKKSHNIIINYKVELGNLAKHGHQGGYYQDLITFSGEQALLMPASSFTEQEASISKAFDQLSITYDMPEGWMYCVPFHSNLNDKGIMTHINSLTWSSLYQIRKACYSFGKFEMTELHKGNSSIHLYNDTSSSLNLTKEEEEGILCLYQYYSELFGHTLPDFSLVFLRSDPIDNSYLIGGVSSQTLGSTFNARTKRDWELLSHRLFHSFFDSKVETASFHTPSELWFYEGLATYYEKMAMSSLPESLQKKLGLEVSSSFKTLFRNYLYTRIKDPSLFALMPMNEESILESPGKTEFLHYTLAPLVIKALEDTSFQKYGLHDRIIKYIVNTDKQNLNSIKGIVRHSINEESDYFAKHYLFGNDILPLWYLLSGHEDNSKVISELNDFEHYFWTWFRLEIQDYPIEKLSDEGLFEISEIAQKEGIEIAPLEIERNIKEFSPTLYALLKQYALRAKICGVDYDDPLARQKLLCDKDNLIKWQEYKTLALN